MEMNSSAVGRNFNNMELQLQTSNKSTTMSANGTSVSVNGMPLFIQFTIALQIIMMLVIVSGNLLVLMAVFHFRSLRDSTGLLVANVALADLFIGLSLPYHISFFYFPDLEKNEMACIMRFTTIMFSCNASIYSLATTVVDRYIAITYPLRYYTIMNKRLVAVLIMVIWGVDILTSCIPLFGVNNWLHSPGCIYELVMDMWYRCFHLVNGVFFVSAMSLLYGRILMIARKHIRQIESERIHYVTTTAMYVTKNMNMVIAIVVVAFNVSWLPFFLVQLTMVDYADVTADKMMLSHFLVFLGIMNSMVNPIIYAWKNRLYYKAFRKLLGLKTKNDVVLSEIASVRQSVYRNSTGATSRGNDRSAFQRASSRNVDVSNIDLKNEDSKV